MRICERCSAKLAPAAANGVGRGSVSIRAGWWLFQPFPSVPAVRFVRVPCFSLRNAKTQTLKLTSTDGATDVSLVRLSRLLSHFGWWLVDGWSSHEAESAVMAGEGMKMLVQHLKEYKDSTSAEIQYLKSKIKALKEQHELVSEEIEEREEQIEEHDRIINNLQSVNSRKYRAEERSDWQTLVESLNEDRDYLNKDLQDIEAATNIFVEEVRTLCVSVCLGPGACVCRGLALRCSTLLWCFFFFWDVLTLCLVERQAI